MGTKKYNDKKNICCTLITKARESKHMSKAELSRKLELYGVYLSRYEIYRIEKSLILLKDFELIAIADILNIDLNSLKNLLDK